MSSQEQLNLLAQDNPYLASRLRQKYQQKEDEDKLEQEMPPEEKKMRAEMDKLIKKLVDKHKCIAFIDDHWRCTEL
jgi:hypothetical protein